MINKNIQELSLYNNQIQNCDIKFKRYEFCITEVKKWFNYLDFIENQNKFIKYGLDLYLIPDLANIILNYCHIKFKID